MGTDWVSLFDRRLCDEILRLDLDGLTRVLEPRRNDVREFSLLGVKFGNGLRAPEIIKTLREEGASLSRIRELLIDALCVSNEQIALDYWACYAEVFSQDPPGSTPDNKLFPEQEEQLYLLLLPEHVDQMLASLKTHAAEVRVMREEQINKLRDWRDMCAREKSHQVAYFFDY
jgi:hypothetical protein